MGFFDDLKKTGVKVGKKIVDPLDIIGQTGADKWLEEAVTGKSKYDKNAAEQIGKVEGLYEGIDTPKVAPVNYKTGTASTGGLAQTSKPWSDISSNYAGIQTKDPETRRRQMDSIEALDRIAQQGGMTLTDKANLNKIRMGTAAADRGRREAIEANAASRGMSSGGNKMLALLSSGQAATNRDSQASQDVAGQARQRALDATMRSGDLSGKLRGQDFDEASTVAAAKDKIASFNASNRANVDMFNAGQLQQMAQFDAKQLQDMDIFNTQTGNAQIDMNNTLLQNEFNNSLKLEDGRARKYLELLAHYQKLGDRDAATKAAMLSGIIGIGTAAL